MGRYSIKSVREASRLFYLLVGVGDILFSRRDASHKPLFFIA